MSFVWDSASRLYNGTGTSLDYAHIGLFVVTGVVLAYFLSPQTPKPSIPPVSDLTSPTGVLSPKEFTSFPLQSKTALSPNTTLYRFSIPHVPVVGVKAPVLGLPIGQHISITATLGEEGAEKKSVMRSYTPTTLDGEVEGFFDLVVKTYEKGNISRYLSLLTIGQEIKVKGPRGKFIYSKSLSPHLLMIAGGTGITPMYQIIKASLRDPADKTVLRLVYANVGEEDILLRSEMDSLASQSNGRFEVYYVLNNPPANWTGGTGFVTREMIERMQPAKGKSLAGSKVLMCGPPPMLNAMKTHLAALDYPAPNLISKLEDQVFCF